MQKAQVGGGWISPALAAHVQKSDAQAQPQTAALQSTPEPVRSQVGGGALHPRVAAHTGVQVGGGFIHPSVAKHVCA